MIDELRQLGLSKQESDTYIATLKLGNAKASEIAQKCTIGRGAVYYTLKLLKEKGFISEVIRSGVKHYSATSPRRLIELIDEERQKKKEAVAAILPELQALHGSALTRPTIEVYERVEGFKAVFLKILENESQDIRCYLSSRMLEFMPQFHTQFRRRRKERGIRIRTITDRTPEMDRIRKMDRKELRTTRYNQFLQGTNSLHYILDDAVIMITANKNEQVAVYVKQKEFAQLQKAAFEQLWKGST